MTEKELKPRFRRDQGQYGWALLIYYFLMSGAVTLCCFAEVMLIVLRDGVFAPELIMEITLQVMMTNGWGYLVASVIGVLMMLLWKKKDFCTKAIWQKEKTMTWGSFFALLCVFISAQAGFQLLAGLLSWIAGLLGLSLEGSIQAAQGIGDSISMFLYAAIAAPIVEELLFRGLILRSLKPYGKKFAILASAFLFGIFHGNIVQSPYAFAVGLILGYVTLEYSLPWAIALHMINNLVLGDLLGRLGKLLPPGVGDLITMAIIWGCAVGTAVILACNWQQLRQYRREGKIHPLCVKSFFTSPGILAVTIVLMGSALLVIL